MDKIGLQNDKPIYTFDRAIQEIWLNTLDLCKECLETDCVDLGPTQNEFEYKNYMIENPLTFGGGGGSTDSGINVVDTGTTDPANVCRVCFKAFKDMGCCEGAALGICANIAVESGFDPSIITWDGSTSSGKFGVGGGLCGFYYLGALPDLARHAGNPSMAQIEELNNKIRNSGLPHPTTPCHPANAKHIRANFGPFPYSLSQQLSYLGSMINGRYSGIKTIESPNEAAMWWCKNYERPAKVTDRFASHGNKVRAYLQGG